MDTPPAGVNMDSMTIFLHNIFKYCDMWVALAIAAQSVP